MNKKLIGLLVLAGSVSVANAQSLAKPYRINGYIKDLQTTNGYVYLRGSMGGTYHTDSVATTDGHFSFSGVSEPVMVKLFTQRVGHPHYINPADFILEGTNVSFTATYDTTEYTYMKDVVVTGSASQDEYSLFLKNATKFMYGSDENAKKINEAYTAADKAKDTAKMTALRKTIMAAYEKRNEFRTTFIKSHPKSFASLYLVSEGARGQGEVLKQSKEMFMLLDPSLQFSVSGKKVSDNMAYASKGEIMNKVADDFAQPMADGKLVKLSDYRGKYVLLDFWASWCGPCRAENPNVLKAYKQYKDKGFDVLAVSLDNDGDKWKKAIAEDKLPWIQVSDLKQSKNAAVQQFGVSGIPDNFLLDPKGVVIARGLRGEELDKKLAEIFSAKKS